MSAPANFVPYEKQSESLAGRACGAACLSMAYRSYGKDVQQAEIWPVIAKANRFGAISSTTYLMAKDASNRGFNAVAFQARHPLQVLRLCRAGGLRAIINHRVERNSAAGHYSVLVDMTANEVILHDPVLGAARRLSHPELLELWMPNAPNSEIAGGVLIALAPTETASSVCEFCLTPMPLRVDCPRCKKAVGMQPAVVLGCIKDGCIARMWNWICCPACDYVFTVKDGVSEASTATAAAPAGNTAPKGIREADLAKFFSAIDKFTSHIATIPAAANHPDVRAQLESVEASKAKLKVVHAADIARRAAVIEQLAALTREHEQKKEAQLKKAAELSKPAPPIDGDALGEALLRDLGFR